MEENNLGQQNIKIKTPLNVWAKLFSITVICLQIGIILRMTYLYTKYTHPGDPFFGLIGYGLPLLILGIIGFSIAFSFLKNKRRNIVSIILLICSIFSVLGNTISQLLATTPLFGESFVNESIKKEKKQQDDLFNQLNGPQKVLYVDANPLHKTNVLILENGDILQFIPSPKFNPKRFSIKSEAEFINWGKNNLIGEEVVIRLPSNLKFKLCNELNNVPYYITDPVFQLREKYDIPKYKGGYCSVLAIYRGESDTEYGAGDISFQGKSLDEVYPK